MPKNVNFSDPASEVGEQSPAETNPWPRVLFSMHCPLQGLPGTKNFYLETEPGVQVGVWQVLPRSLVEHSDDKDSDWWDAQLNDGRCNQFILIKNCLELFVQDCRSLSSRQHCTQSWGAQERALSGTL